MNFLKLVKSSPNNFPKRFSFGDGKKHVYHRIKNRLGDEIFTTALIKYLTREKQYFFHYDPDCYAINSQEYFPKNIVNFVKHNSMGLKEFNPGSLWLWNQMLQKKQYYCEIQDQYDKTKADIDVVFFPLINPEYNATRILKKECSFEIFNLLVKKFSKTVMIVDFKKKEDFEFSHPNFFYVSDFKDAFSLIKRSKVFIGCDTGISHYAGSINHPKMVLIYPDYELLKVDDIYLDLKKWISKEFKENEIFDYKFSSHPCCNPDNYRTMLLRENSINPYRLLEIVDEFLS